MKTVKRIIGIDPALTKTGWAVIDSSGNERKYIASGVIKTDASAPLSERLALIYQGVGEIYDLYQPNECAVEYTFVNKNPTSTLLLGHGRAASIIAAGTRAIPVFEY
ncbi:MAG: crossover junction endodeoxyribonuclease RuvC, partial [Alphaproteobacteria bacterium]|nr:crossover junction endodeoxyribonuclease RuvC [Alphaproteobacteria bacterium]